MNTPRDFLRWLWMVGVALALLTAYTIGYWNGFSAAKPADHHPVKAPHSHAAAPAEDDPTWDCSTQGNRRCGPTPVPEWLTCNVITDEALWQECYRNINTGRSKWIFVGDYDGHRNVWVIPGDTSVFVTNDGWVESS